MSGTKKLFAVEACRYLDCCPMCESEQTIIAMVAIEELNWGGEFKVPCPALYFKCSKCNEEYTSSDAPGDPLEVADFLHKKVLKKKI